VYVYYCPAFGYLSFCFSADGTGLKQTIRDDGTWRIRKPEKSPVIELFKVEEHGSGDILSPAFTAWRSSND
jgi:hypothetical protein